MDKHLQVVGAIFIKDNKLLALRRGASQNAAVAFKYEFAGGKVENGEDYPSALLRELKEELELTAQIINYFMSVTYDYPKYTVTLHTYKCEIKSDYKLNEHIEQRWLSVNELNPEEWAPADAPIIQRLINEMKKY